MRGGRYVGYICVLGSELVIIVIIYNNNNNNNNNSNNTTTTTNNNYYYFSGSSSSSSIVSTGAIYLNLSKSNQSAAELKALMPAANDRYVIIITLLFPFAVQKYIYPPKSCQ